jgi:tetratricopeptide (TPR) repeat protein
MARWHALSLSCGLAALLWLPAQTPERAAAQDHFAAGNAALAAGDAERALSCYSAALSSAKPRDGARCRLALAQAALLAGEPGRAEAALEALPAELPAALAERRALLQAALLHRRGQRQAELAQQVEAEPFAWQAALRDLERAEEAWRQALDLAAGDRPALRRNWQRTRELRLAFERQAAAAEKPPESTPEPPPPGETEIVAEQPQAAPPEPAALGPEELLLLLERLESRERLKRAQREQTARRSAASGQRDW